MEILVEGYSTHTKLVMRGLKSTARDIFIISSKGSAVLGMGLIPLMLWANVALLSVAT